MKEWSSPTSHCVETMLRSIPVGRGGAGGTSPFSMRSVQSDSAFSVRFLAHLAQQRIHVGSANADAQAPFPSVGVGLQLRLGGEDVLRVASQRIAELVAEIATRLRAS